MAIITAGNRTPICPWSISWHCSPQSSRPSPKLVNAEELLMDLSLKDIRFLVDALKHYEEHLDRCLEEKDLSDDELADLANDRQYLLTLREYLQGHHDRLLTGSESVSTKV